MRRVHPEFPKKLRTLLCFSLLFSLAHVSLDSQMAALSPVELASKLVGEKYVRHQEPEYLSFEELKKLYLNPKPEGEIKKKLETFWGTPIISNEAFFLGAKPKHPKNPSLGEFLRIASWNIEKSFHVNETIQLLTSKEAFQQMIDSSKAAPGSELEEQMHKQREHLLEADVLIFQEMEIGLKRSGYKNAAAELARALDMNYAYAAQYLEIDPVTLGLEELIFEEEDKAVENDARDFFSVDPNLYKGVFGSAVLSKYPIKYVEVRPLRTQPYDWYTGELQKTGATEKARRAGAKSLFKNVIQRELKVGGRHYFRVDLEVPGLAEKTLTLINIHLEIKCEPEGRERQMREILSYVRDIKNPVVLMGDFNMAPTDISSTTAGRILKRSAKNPTTWFSLAVNVLSPHALVINTSRMLSNFTKNLNDPTARHIPVVAPNPIKPFFEMMENFRFLDGKTFDLRGNPSRSVGNKDKTLSNSNQRGKKGFVTTFRVLRPIGIVGKFRLDWVFVKSYSRSPNNESESYRFAPHFGETLEDMNYNLTLPVSDHAPNVVDLPFKEPNL